MRLYLDTTEWIYHFEGHPNFGPPASALIAAMLREGHVGVSSLFVLSEILVGPRRIGNHFAVARLRRFFLSGAVQLAPYTLRAMDIFITLRANHRVKPLDALHLSIAATANVDYFITNDAALHKLSISGITRICSSADVPF